MNINKPFVIAIAAVSGGGKTTVTNQLNEMLPCSKALYFDDYEFSGPSDICNWVEMGADYNEWILTPMINDLNFLLSDKTQSLSYILLDYPFAYKNHEMAKFIDYTIFIDTPLDIAMARRILRDFKDASIDNVQGNMNFYLSHGRMVYLEALTTIKPNSDLLIDGSLPIDIIVNKIYKKIKEVSK